MAGCVMLTQDKYIALRGKEYELFRHYRGVFWCAWRIKFRGEHLAWATSEREARKMAREHKAQRKRGGLTIW